ncbi:unnamed protein product [Orchesella dallaii]|uniref:Uncharacterized protein n=1 Tax=Orchesella dallaii TaxID=48710 RepID=A0ABP1RKY3_9HEXA
MGGPLSGIGLHLVFATLFVISGNVSAKSAWHSKAAGQDEVVRYLGNPSPIVNITIELLSISEWYCSKLLDPFEWQASASIIINYAAEDRDGTDTPLDIVKTLNECANWYRGTGGGPEQKEYPEPDIYARVFGGIYNGVKYLVRKAAEIPKYFSRQWEINRRGVMEMDDLEMTEEEVMYILTLLMDIEETACDKEYFPLDKHKYRLNMQIIRHALEEVKDDGLLRELINVRRTLEYCLEGDKDEYWEKEEERDERLRLESEVFPDETTTTRTMYFRQLEKEAFERRVEEQLLRI